MRMLHFNARLAWSLLVLLFVLVVPGGPARGAEPVQGGVIRVATNAEPPTLDWQSSTTTATRLVAWHIFESLFALDQDYEVKPLLAQGFTVSPDGLRYTIRLRTGIKFHNGQPMRPEDVIASLERWGKLSSGGRETFKFIKQIRRIDDATIEIDLARGFTPLITNLGDPKQAAVIMPKSVAESSGLKPATELIGTGPYSFKRWTPGQEIVLVKNPAYVSRSENWGGITGRKVAYADEIDFFPVTDPQVRLAGVSTGQYDLALELPQDVYAGVKANPNLTADMVKVFNWMGAVFNKANGVFTDERLRQAALYAMKPADLMAAAAGPKEFWKLDPGLFFPEQKGLYSTAGSEIYNHQNLDKARSLMKAAGYHGQKIVVMSTKDYTWNNNAAQVLVPELQAVGFNVDSQVFDWPTLINRRTKKDLWDIFLTGFSPSIDPTAVIFFGSNWPGWYESKAMDAQLSRWSQTPVTDAAARKALMDQIQTTFYKEVPVAKFGNSYGLEVYNNQQLHGYTSFFDVRFWNTWVTH
ncbi:MAG TPA: ABC transporter substrate-binding protein [Candidatus Methylomirabilis sp.]|nr:ABC transporter substrate-binding protein [Candidatus Methylomirabilis sp.]